LNKWRKGKWVEDRLDGIPIRSLKKKKLRKRLKRKIKKPGKLKKLT
jgi:hypothetical protein